MIGTETIHRIAIINKRQKNWRIKLNVVKNIMRIKLLDWYQINNLWKTKLRINKHWQPILKNLQNKIEKELPKWSI